MCTNVEDKLQNEYGSNSSFSTVPKTWIMELRPHKICAIRPLEETDGAVIQQTNTYVHEKDIQKTI
jgi:hypothetical protein